MTSRKAGEENRDAKSSESHLKFERCCRRKVCVSCSYVTFWYRLFWLERFQSVSLGETAWKLRTYVTALLTHSLCHRRHYRTIVIAGSGGRETLQSSVYFVAKWGSEDFVCVNQSRDGMPGRQNFWGAAQILQKRNNKHPEVLANSRGNGLSISLLAEARQIRRSLDEGSHACKDWS